MTTQLSSTTTDFFTVAQERSSVRHYDPTFKLSTEEIKELLNIAIQAPSSSNLQPWRFLIIQDEALKDTLLPIASNQQQVKTSSAVIAVLGDVEAYKHAERIYAETVKKGSMTEEAKNAYLNVINSHYANLSEADATGVAFIDGGLVAMQLMLAARAKGLDTVPMGGFNRQQFIEAFNVPANLKPVMLIALGKATQSGFEKNRLPLEDVVQWETY